jgi:hypothetical protein
MSTMSGWRRIAAAAFFAAGCQSAQRAPYQDNPLLLSREPLSQPAAPVPKSTAPTVTKVKPSTQEKKAAPVTAAAIDVPQLPSFATSLPGSMTPPPGGLKPVANVEMAPAPVAMRPAEPVFIPAPAANLPPPPIVRPAVAANPGLPLTYAHDPDYQWLQGEIDVHYRGHKELRFRPASEDDAIGGKVRLVDDPRLADLQMGDIVRVEGELVRDDPTAVGGQGPRYHVKSVQLVKAAGRR